ncbi:MAG: hypothetical protein U0794_16050 [Isosphaeraceae bacterium]
MRNRTQRRSRSPLALEPLEGRLVLSGLAHGLIPARPVGEAMHPGSPPAQVRALAPPRIVVNDDDMDHDAPATYRGASDFDGVLPSHGPGSVEHAPDAPPIVARDMIAPPLPSGDLGRMLHRSGPAVLAAPDVFQNLVTAGGASSASATGAFGNVRDEATDSSHHPRPVGQLATDAPGARALTAATAALGDEPEPQVRGEMPDVGTLPNLSATVAEVENRATSADPAAEEPLGAGLIAEVVPFDGLGMGAAVSRVLDRLDAMSKPVAAEARRVPIIWLISAGLVAFETTRRWLEYRRRMEGCQGDPRPAQALAVHGLC